jgi:hypothetical protein
VSSDPPEANREAFLALVLEADRLARAGVPAAASDAVDEAELLIKTERVPEHRIRMTAVVASTRKIVDEGHRRAAKKARKAAEQAALSCASCHRSGTNRPIRMYGETYLCGSCWNKRRTGTCTECLKPFTRSKDASQARKCPQCRTSVADSRSVRTIRGGLPTLGKRT